MQICGIMTASTTSSGLKAEMGRLCSCQYRGTVSRNTLEAPASTELLGSTLQMLLLMQHASYRLQRCRRQVPSAVYSTCAQAVAAADRFFFWQQAVHVGWCDHDANALTMRAARGHSGAEPPSPIQQPVTWIPCNTACTHAHMCKASSMHTCAQ
jgi:hypothetical protein